MARTGRAASGETVSDIIVLDTSALVADPEVILSYPDYEVVVPLTAVQELDGLKKRTDQGGRSAREAIRLLWGLIEGIDPSQISEPVKLSNGGYLRIEVNGQHPDMVAKYRLSLEEPDNRILNTALNLHQSSNRPVTLVSNDVNFRIKAAVVGLVAEELRAGVVQTGDVGYYEVQASPKLVDRLYQAKREGHPATWEDLGGRKDSVLLGCEDAQINEFFDIQGGGQAAIARVTETGLQLIEYSRPYGLRGRTAEQHMAINLLTDPSIKVVALAGRAGTGKSLLALATGLAQTVGEDFFYEPGCNDKFGNQKKVADRKIPGTLYERMAIYRPVYAVGHQDLGFLPGDKDEKLQPWMEAVVDAMVALSAGDSEDSLKLSYESARERLDGLKASERLTMDAITYLRGRSLQRHFIVVDEAQNYELGDLRTVLTRVGEGTKIVYVGDTTQIDNPFASAHSNALAYLVERFAGNRLFGHLVLQHGQRSEVADLAASRL